MNNLNELIGQKVTASILNEKGDYIDFKCKVRNVNINDWYFEENGEQIYINVDVDPIDELPEGFDMEVLGFIPLEDIRR